MGGMKRKRILGAGAAYYHCMSRVVGGERLLGEREKEVFRGMLWRVADFCGVRVLSYALMSNHFHVLVWVPEEEAVSDGELARRYRGLYETSRSARQPKPEVLEVLLRENGSEGQAWRRRLVARMGDVSAFMKTLKQRFSLWYNRTHGRFGTLWASRFKSVLVEGSRRALMTVAAYIDLNPVRAGLVEDPADYRWCGYGEAMGGQPEARAGLQRIWGEAAEDWKTTVEKYRCFLFGIGSGGAAEKLKIPRARALAVMAEGGTVSPAEALRCRVRYFTAGGVFGSARFVRQWLESDPNRALKKRPGEPHAMRGADWEGLTVARGLRKGVFA
jgi:putative transposase